MEGTETFSLAYILITLLIRFVGVFLVLLIIMVAMTLMGYVTPRVIEALERRKNAAKDTVLGEILQHAVDTQEEDLSLAGEVAPTGAADAVAAEAAPEPELAAVIGLALELAMGVSSQLVKEEVQGLPPSWVVQGRARQLR
jgi:hypothetical protein